MESVARGGTRWKRFAIVMVPSVAATAAIGVGLAQGALAASFAVSGQEFKVSAGSLDGKGFAQYGGVVEGYVEVDGDKKVKRPVMISTFKSATIEDMCQSVVMPVPLLGTFTLRLEAGQGDSSVSADNLYLDISELKADVTRFDNIDIGIAARHTDERDNSGKGPVVKDTDMPNGFAQQADEAYLTNVKQKTFSTTAGTFRLGGLDMRLKKGSGKGVECFTD
ncbi:DUF6230 family protein [Streptomyces qinzhouensis]|uniref:Cholesterol esterase n=1 Tax=Streptomyces qinzhouensis TaxID=2599401 RepID=A0A5B8JMQ9_9ACTN|nr:DUF6230 family protein [Streptomyces qinzhouensis]QDY79080.1 cholesterol esterase [Streptomyces qinzhouensis]